jgi:hypothetical protein
MIARASGNTQQIGLMIKNRMIAKKGITSACRTKPTISHGLRWLKLKYSPSCSVP